MYLLFAFESLKHFKITHRSAGVCVIQAHRVFTVHSCCGLLFRSYTSQRNSYPCRMFVSISVVQSSRLWRRDSCRWKGNPSFNLPSWPVFLFFLFFFLLLLSLLLAELRNDLIQEISLISRKSAVWFESFGLWFSSLLLLLLLPFFPSNPDLSFFSRCWFFLFE